MLLVSWSPFAIRLTADDGHEINPQSRRLRSSDPLPQMDLIRRNLRKVSGILRHRHFISWTFHRSTVQADCRPLWEDNRFLSRQLYTRRGNSLQDPWPFKSTVSGTLTEVIERIFHCKITFQFGSRFGYKMILGIEWPTPRMPPPHLMLCSLSDAKHSLLSSIFELNELHCSHSLKRVSHQSACGYPTKLHILVSHH